jgi:hypothetical protein
LLWKSRELGTIIEGRDQNKEKKTANTESKVRWLHVSPRDERDTKIIWMSFRQKKKKPFTWHLNSVETIPSKYIFLNCYISLNNKQIKKTKQNFPNSWNTKVYI